MNKKYEFKGALLEEFKKALKYLANYSPDNRVVILHGVPYSHKQVYEEVAQQTDVGKEYTKAVEHLCNRYGDKLTPREYFRRMYREGDEYKKEAMKFDNQSPAP